MSWVGKRIERMTIGGSQAIPVPVRLLLPACAFLCLSACFDDGRSSTTRIAEASGTNSPPIIQGAPPRTVTAGTPYSYAPIISDPDGDPLSYSVTSRPAWAEFDAETGRLAGSPQESDVGQYTGIAISASDGQTESMVGPFTVVVASATAPPPPSANSAPVISGTPAPSVTAGSAYGFTPTASDAEGDQLIFAIQNKPLWSSFDTASGRLSGTPDGAAAGFYSGIVISVSDGAAEAALEPFSIRVESQSGMPPESNSPPTISGSPATAVTVGQGYWFVPGATDPDGDALTFSIRNPPAWASFSTSTGRLSGTPSAGAVGTYGGIEISVGDGAATATLPTFSIVVLAPDNTAPVIAGSPPRSVTAGTFYSFTPSASDADGDTLAFSIQNQPDWAGFNSSTGRLSGTPTAADVGTYASIVIGVSDGEASASLGAFSIAVEQISTGSVTLSWTPPTQNTDGSALNDLAGYRIVYGTSSNTLNRQLQYMNPGLTTAVVENLASGTWYFAVKALNSASVESDLSNVASKAIP